MSSEAGAPVLKGVATRKAVTAALEAHVQVLEGAPLRRATSEALAAAEGLGGKERRFVAWATRELSRHRRRIELSLGARGLPSRGLQLVQDQALAHFVVWRLELTHAAPATVLREVALPGPLRPRSLPDAVIAARLVPPVAVDLGREPLDRLANTYSFPTWLARALVDVAPPGEAEALFQALNRDPVLWLRARPASRVEAIVADLRAQGIEVTWPTRVADRAPAAILLASEGRAIFESRAMKAGQLEVIDVGSQLLLALAGLEPGQSVLDACAGAGTKTLAIADAVGPSGRVYAADVSASRLAEARRRVQVARLRHVTFPRPPRVELADVVVIDAPCSGTGTLGREPQAKWTLTEAQVKTYAATQRSLLEQHWPAMRPGARLLYATCSLLAEENEDVVDGLLARTSGASLVGSERIWPHHHGGGGFFGALLHKG